MAPKAKERSVESGQGASEVLASEFPYVVHVLLRGTTDLLFHRWNTEEVAAKSAAMKNSTAKKSDNVESYLWRDDGGDICLPGEYVRQSIIHAAKYSQDPRSPRKSAMDLVRAGVHPLTNLAKLGHFAAGGFVPTSAADYLDSRRVVVQRNAVTRTRPAMFAGWCARMSFQVITPELLPPSFLRELFDRAGKLIGTGDFRPTFGRFVVDSWEVSVGD